MPPVVIEDPEVPHVTRVSQSEDFPRPHVGVLGAIHGNERCGLTAVERLAREARAGTLAPSAGTWVLVHGNPAATEAGRRFSKGGADLNRLFDLSFVEDLREERWTPEHHRARALVPLLEDLDSLLDLHSATWPTPPFAVINDVPESTELAARLGLDFITTGWGAPGLLMDKVTMGVMQRHGRPGVSVECGQHDDPASVGAAWDCALRFLRATGVLAGGAPRGTPKLLEVVEIVSRPSEGFRFTKSLRGLQRLEAGEVFAADQLAELRVREPCFILMPNDRVPVGRDMVFLARELTAG